MVGRPSVQGLKLSIPTVSAVAPPRLVDAVLATPPGGVTLLVAAPGYGRTTVAAAAARAACEPVAWVSLDVMDEVPGRLLAHVEAAVDATLSGAGGAETVRHRAEGAVGRWDALLDAWSAAPPTWLVLDDLHHATDEETVRGLAYLAARLPPTVRLLATSRVDLPALTAGLRSSVGFRVLDETSLSLTRKETLEALVVGGLTVDEPDASRLTRLCAGWPAAVAAAHRHPGSPAEVVTWLVGTGAEQLLSDWWAGLPAAWRDFLLGTAHLARLHPELCELALGSSGPSALLFDLVAAHAFLLPAQHGELIGWDRHPLLSELLRHRVGRQPADAEQLRVVARWAGEHGDVDTQVRALVAAGDQAEAAALVRLHEEPFIQQGRAKEVLEWYRLLPPDAVADRGGMLLRQAWAAVLGRDLAQARILHGMLRSTLESAPAGPEQAELRGDEAALAAHLAMCDASPVQMLAEVSRAEAAFGDAWTRPVHQSVAVSRARALLWLGRHDDAVRATRAIRARGVPMPAVALCILPGLEGGIALAQGQVRVAHALATQALSVVDDPALPGARFGLVPARLCRGLCLVDLGEPDAARDDLERVVALSREEGLLGYEVVALAGLARLEWTVGRGMASVEVVRRARAALGARAPRSPLVHHLTAVEALARIGLGDAARAERLIATLPPRPTTSLLAVRLAQLRRPGSGTTRLERLVATDPRVRAEQGLLMAAAVAAQQPSRAVPLLLEATALADASGLMTLLVGAGDGILDLARAEARRSADDGLTRMVDIASRGPARARTESHLSAGDRELLTLLPGRDSNEAMAARLSVSVNTVKTRLRRLYAKLEVGSRDEAVRVARERGLID